MRVICVFRRSILDYFSKERCKIDLLDPRGPLSSKIFPSTIAAANTDIMRVMNGPSELELKSTGEKRGPYNKYRIACYLHGKLFSRTCQNPLKTEMLTEENFAKRAVALIMIMFAICMYICYSPI